MISFVKKRKRRLSTHISQNKKKTRHGCSVKIVGLYNVNDVDIVFDFKFN